MTSNETDEIEKIMNEIEELQKEMAPSTHVSTSAAESSMSGIEEDILREIQDAALPGGSEGSLEETLAELKQEEATGGVLAAIREDAQEETHVDTHEDTMSHSNSNGDGTLSLTLTGNMTLKLKYDFEGQEVVISFADQSLRVQMTDGTEFKVPVTRAQAPSQSRSSNVKPFKKAV